MSWDAFISHASEDKDDVARPLAEALQSRGLRIWFDESALRAGDSLRRSIDAGLRLSHFGVVILSPAFITKQWPQSELDGLFAREMRGKKVIVPIWHRLGIDEVLSYSPMLADRVALFLSSGLDYVADRLLDVIRPEAFAKSECIRYLTDRCGFKISNVQDALMEASDFLDFVNRLTVNSERLDMEPSMLMTFDLPNARVGLNDARTILGLSRFNHEFF